MGLIKKIRDDGYTVLLIEARHARLVMGVTDRIVVLESSAARSPTVRHAKSGRQPGGDRRIPGSADDEIA